MNASESGIYIINFERSVLSCIYIPEIKKKVADKCETGLVFILLVSFYNRKCCQ